MHGVDWTTPLRCTVQEFANKEEKVKARLCRQDRILEDCCIERFYTPDLVAVAYSSPKRRCSYEKLAVCEALSQE